MTALAALALALRLPLPRAAWERGGERAGLESAEREVRALAALLRGLLLRGALLLGGGLGGALGRLGRLAGLGFGLRLRLRARSLGPGGGGLCHDLGRRSGHPVADAPQPGALRTRGVRRRK